MRLLCLLLALTSLLQASLVAAESVPAEPRAVPARFSAEGDAAVQSFIDRQIGTIVDGYRDLHANPELSLFEERTARRVAEALRESGFDVHERIGGHGVVGVLENGEGPTLLLRGDMDALPITEATGLDYASRVTTKQDSGGTVGVMHACGHDVHVTNLLATARFLAQERDLWAGRLLILAQPAEELGRGAREMLADGLFERFGSPDYIVGLHVTPELAAGQVGVISGFATANVDAVDIVLRGRGGHGARPHQAIDPIVTGAHLVTALQTLVSRRLDPQDPGVVTVGSFHAGTKHNVIPDEARLQITVRSYSDSARKLLLEGIEQLARDVCATHRCPEPPEVVVKDEFTPSGYNHPELAAAARGIFERTFGAEQVAAPRPTMGGEDFARYSRATGAPGLLFRLGVTDPAALAASREPGGAPIPSLHSSQFAPAAEPALRTSIRATANLVISLLPPARSESQ